MRFLWNNHQHMKHFVIILLSLLTSFDVFAADSLKVIYRIRLDQDIDKSSQRLVTLGLEKALEADSDYILLDLDTYGGAVDAADSIRSAILRCPVPVVAYVNMQISQKLVPLGRVGLPSVRLKVCDNTFILQGEWWA